MRMKIIMKFGGSVLDQSSKLDKIIKICTSFKNIDGVKNDLVCVVSALSGVTDKILSLTGLIMKGNRDAIKIFVDDMRIVHMNLIEETITDNALRLEAKEIVLGIIDEFQDILDGLALISEITPRSLDHI
ncbi:MAG TPA: hypothetical protein VER14_00615, partial [Phototrophicaceae bacterium]|nr:hypothetical protein [Phototrophicaceae bacterium]